jgi:hypothetical protein
MATHRQIKPTARGRFLRGLAGMTGTVAFAGVGYVVFVKDIGGLGWVGLTCTIAGLLGALVTYEWMQR